MNVSQIDEVFTFTVMSGETQLSENLYYSASSYIAATNNNEDVAQLLKALLAYGRASNSYAN
jgi:hypothetical protein